MKNLLMLILLFFSVNVYSDNEELEQLLIKLDSILSCSDKYVAEKETKIEELRKRQSSVMKPEEKLWLNKMFYDEFYVYNADSAMIYVNDNIDISRELGRKDWEQEWLLNKVFLLSATGLLGDAEDVIKSIDINNLNKDLMFQYYDSKIYLYSHLGQYIGSNQELAYAYYKREAELKFEAQKYINSAHPSYHSFYASLYKDYPRGEEGDSIKEQLKRIVDNSPLNTRYDAINSYVLSVMYNNEGDEYNYMKYLIYSAMADIRICNRDIASLEELSNILYNHSDIDRGYTYIGYCLKSALLYPNRVRVVNISSIMDKLRYAYQKRNIEQENKLRTSLSTVSIMFVVLLVSIFFIYFQNRKLVKSRRNLDESNRLLSQHLHELSEAQQMLADVNNELSDVNEKLKTSNNQLQESNYVKEEYIGYVFSICSSYISKLDEYRKNIGRKLKAGQIDDIKLLTSSTTMVQNELKEFYHSFDAIFLHVYPDFVEDFNSLLRPEERIVLKEGELLNTELRIYALVRLGISDSVKIAEFLHCSPQTVYNNRLKTRNKAVIPKEKFADTVRSLGKMQK
ncbi:MAG: transcriptional regulator [Candidatus Phocaeicola faecipullorum]|nr:transcriptional regulator [Candidatus Phocaeicola faecipullorum]